MMKDIFADSRKLFPRPLTADEERALARAAAPGNPADERLCTWAYHLAARYIEQNFGGHEPDDLLAGCHEEVILVARRFDPDREVRLDTFLRSRLFHHLWRLIYDDHLVRIPRYLQQELQQVRQHQAQLEQERGRAVTAEEAAEDLGLDVKKVLAGFAAQTPTERFDLPVDEELFLDETLAADVEAPDALLLRREFWAELPLSKRDVEILRLRRDLTFEEISTRLGITRAAAQKAHERALARLRATGKS